MTSLRSSTDHVFASFVKSLSDATNINLFVRGDGCFTIHGKQAENIARKFYRTTSVLKKEEGGIETLTVYRKQLSQISSNLLCNNQKLQVSSNKSFFISGSFPYYHAK